MTFPTETKVLLNDFSDGVSVSQPSHQPLKIKHSVYYSSVRKNHNISLKRNMSS